MASSIHIEITDELDRELAKLDAVLRMPVLKKGLRKAGNVVVKRTKQNLPKPGYPGDKPGLKPLRDTVATRVKEYSSGKVVAIVGYAYPAGSHAHFVEAGHRKVLWGRETGGFVEGGWYLQKAADATESEQGAAIDSAIAAELNRG